MLSCRRLPSPGNPARLSSLEFGRVGDEIRRVMFSKTWLPVAALIGVVLTAACGGSLKTVRTTVTAPAAVAAAPALPPTITPLPVQDPVTALIAESQRHFTDGEQELGVGHLEQARKAFDAAVDVLLQSPYGARS